jgi:Cytochrome c
MKALLTTATALALLVGVPLAAQASPQQDLKEFREYYMKKFPGVSLQEFANGVYAIDPVSRVTWEALEEDFPPYEDDLKKGEKLFKTPFKNGKTYASCFPNGGVGIAQNYPYFDAANNTVKTLEQEINECRVKNGEEPLKAYTGDAAFITAYMAYTSRGKKVNVVVPNDPNALAWYERGKRHFYMKRGQLNLSCANCHKDSAGHYIRAEMLSPALGHTTHFPVYRQTWGNMGTLHRRYQGCNEQVRAKGFGSQSDEYRALEYFHTYMSNGIEMNGPGSRK